MDVVVDRAAIVKQRQEAAVMLLNGAFKEAEPNLRTALAQTTEMKNAETFMWMQRLAECLIGQRKYREAEPLAKSASQGFRKFGQDDEDMHDCNYWLAVCYHGQNKNAEAGELARNVLKDLENNDKRGPEHPTTLKCRALVALTLKAQCKFDDAAAVAKQTMEYSEAVALKAQGSESTGSRRLTQFERKALKEVDAISSSILGQPCKLKRISTIESTTTCAPDENVSRLSSKESISVM